jgi:hypothetical protein
MKVIGKDIGTALDEMYETIEKRVRIEAECALSVVPFEGGSFSTVDWEDGAVVIALHNGVPRRALPHVFGVALQHVRQRLDRYPNVVPALGGDAPEGALLRSVLRELILAPEAELQLSPLGLDLEWETKQRHTGMKELLRDADADWNEPGTPGNAFAALQYAHFSLTHPPKLWESLWEQMAAALPVAVAAGEGVLKQVLDHGWNSSGACVESLTAARDELALQPVALIEDRRTGQLL